MWALINEARHRKLVRLKLHAMLVDCELRVSSSWWERMKLAIILDDLNVKIRRLS